MPKMTIYLFNWFPTLVSKLPICLPLGRNLPEIENIAVVAPILMEVMK